MIYGNKKRTRYIIERYDSTNDKWCFEMDKYLSGTKVTLENGIDWITNKAAHRSKLRYRVVKIEQTVTPLFVGPE